MARFCKETRCSYNKLGEPCELSDKCFLFEWDLSKESGGTVYGGAKTAVPLEEEEQRLLAAWLNAKGLVWAHIPNERKATLRVLAELERQGLKKGFPDNFIAEPRKGLHGLFIELKRAKKSLSRVSKEQKQWVAELRNKGYAACVCYGAQHAIRVISDYLEEGV